MTICINQLIRPTIFIQMNGVGNCMVCKPCLENKQCLHFKPININTIDIKKEK